VGGGVFPGVRVGRGGELVSLYKVFMKEEEEERCGVNKCGVVVRCACVVRYGFPGA